MLDFKKSFDVIIAGAGVAGVAAALETARAGLRTALVEKTTLVGGLATSGLINMYLPLCDGLGHQVIYGIAEELLHLSIKYGPGDVPPNWQEQPGSRPNDDRKSKKKPRYRTPFSPASFVLALDEVLEQAGVDLWLDTLVCQAVIKDATQTSGVRRIVGIEVENKSGRGRLMADCVIDATGDADVAHRAGAPCIETDNWLSVWAIQNSLETARKAVSDPQNTPLLDVLRLGASPEGRGMPPDIPKLRGTDGKQVTRFILESHRLLREYYSTQTQNDDDGTLDRHTLFPVTLPTMAQFRTTRRIVGRETMTEGQADVHLPTSVGLAPDWRKAGPVWEIPYGALVPRDIAGLLAAGRCISSVSAETYTNSPWEITRVIPAAALTGQIAGIAARLAFRQSTTPDTLQANVIQKELSTLKLPFHIEEVR